MRFLSKPKIEQQQHLPESPEIDRGPIHELSIALDNLDMERIKFILNQLSNTYHRKTRIPASLGISRSGFHKMLSSNGNPEFMTILRLLNLLDIKLQAEPRQ